MCGGDEDTVFCRVVVVALAMEVLVCVGGFSVYRGQKYVVRPWRN